MNFKQEPDITALLLRIHFGRKGLNIKSTHLPITQHDIVWIHHSVLPLTFNPCQAALLPIHSGCKGLNINDDTVSPSCLACFNNLQLLQGWTYNYFYNLWPLTSVRLRWWTSSRSQTSQPSSFPSTPAARGWTSSRLPMCSWWNQSWTQPARCRPLAESTGSARPSKAFDGKMDGWMIRWLNGWIDGFVIGWIGG